MTKSKKNSKWEMKSYASHLNGYSENINPLMGRKMKLTGVSILSEYIVMTFRIMEQAHGVASSTGSNIAARSPESTSFGDPFASSRNDLANPFRIEKPRFRASVYERVTLDLISSRETHSKGHLPNVSQTRILSPEGWTQWSGVSFQCMQSVQFI